MNKSFKETNPIALITDSLPVRSRIGVVLMVADLALERLESAGKGRNPLLRNRTAEALGRDGDLSFAQLERAMSKT